MDLSSNGLYSCNKKDKFSPHEHIKKDSDMLLDKGMSQMGRPPILEGKFSRSKSPFLGCSAKPN